MIMKSERRKEINRFLFEVNIVGDHAVDSLLSDVDPLLSIIKNNFLTN